MVRKIPVSSKITIALFLVALLFATPILSQEFMSSDYERGNGDGRRDGTTDASMIWAVVGFGCGCCGVGAAYLWAQPVPSGRLVGKSPEYVSGYTTTYKKAKRERETIYAAAGCILSSLLSSIYSALNPPTWEY